MTNEIQVFSNEKFGTMRSIVIDNEPWFAGKDVAEALGYKDTKNALKDHVDEEDKRIVKGGDLPPLENHLPKSAFPIEFVRADIPNRGMTFVNESGVYALVFGSKLEKAKEFKHWVTSEVLPTIRKTGGYVHNSEVFIQNYLPFADDTTKQLFRLTLDVVDKQNKQIADQQKELAEKSAAIEEMTPKASYYDLVINSPDLIPITIIAKDYGKSGTWLNRKLNEKGVQYRREKTWVLYHQYADKGYVGTKTYAYSGKAYGAEKHVSINTFWTQKGRLFIYELLKGEGILPIVERGVA